MPRRVCTFAVAHTDISAQPFNNAARTVRIFAPNNLSGSAVYVKFSNYYSDGPVWVGNATIGLADAKGRLVPDTVRPLTVHGDTSFALVPQRDVFSDRVALPVQPGCTIAVSLYYPGGEKVTSGNFVGIFANRSVKGDHCDAPALPKARLWTDLSKSVLPWDISSATTTLSEVIVEQDDALPAPRVVAMFGDSIMQQGAWVTPFTARLYEHFRGEVSVCNLGIGGNRLLYGATPASRGMYGHRALPLRPASHRGPHPRGVRSRHQRSGAPRHRRRAGGGAYYRGPVRRRRPHHRGRAAQAGRKGIRGAHPAPGGEPPVPARAGGAAPRHHPLDR